MWPVVILLLSIPKSQLDAVLSFFQSLADVRWQLIFDVRALPEIDSAVDAICQSRLFLAIFVAGASGCKQKQVSIGCRIWSVSMKMSVHQKCDVIFHNFIHHIWIAPLVLAVYSHEAILGDILKESMANKLYLAIRHILFYMKAIFAMVAHYGRMALWHVVFISLINKKYFSFIKNLPLFSAF